MRRFASVAPLRNAVPRFRAVEPVILTSGYFDLERSIGMSEVSLRSRLIGAWQLVNFVMRDMATNAEERPWGEHPLGLILYTHDGYVSAQLQESTRRHGRATAAGWSRRGPLRLRLMVNSNFGGCRIGKSAGLRRQPGAILDSSCTKAR